MSLTGTIKEFALNIGYSRVGISPAENLADYAEELRSRGEHYAFFIEGPRQPLKGAYVKDAFPEAKSIISVAYDISRCAYPEIFVGKIGRQYLSRSHAALTNHINGARAQLFRAFLEENGCKVLQRIVISERTAAARAGIVTYGRNGFVYADGIGSWIVLGSFIVDQELEYDVPTVELKCPPDCRACMDACPTKAIYEPLKLNPLRCVAFNTFMTQDGAKGGVTSHIPHEIREKMGTWVHGCDMCQAVCPRNQARLKTKMPEDPFLELIAKDFSLVKMLNMTDEYYAQRIRPIMYNYIKEKKYLQRNAAIALGNLGDPAFVPDLAQALNDAESLVREYAAWALGRIGGEHARNILKAHLQKELEDTVKNEIARVLSSKA